jgi:hypothetical protein
MREDMYKVIVERPRRGGGVQGDGRNWRNSRDRGAHLGMQRGYASRKWLNENLAPLKRWLHKQVHRPRGCGVFGTQPGHRSRCMDRTSFTRPPSGSSAAGRCRRASAMGVERHHCARA